MKIAYIITGSFCNHKASLDALALLAREHEIIPVVSFNTACTCTRFGTADDMNARISEICGRSVVATIEEAEPVGPVLSPDIAVIAPCTGNTLAKIAHGISDTPATLAVKAHMRSGRPTLIALCTNDALSGNFKNIATMYQRKNVYFVPMIQDDIKNKPSSLVADFSRIPEAVFAATEGRQLLPLFM